MSPSALANRQSTGVGALRRQTHFRQVVHKVLWCICFNPVGSICFAEIHLQTQVTDQ